MKRRNQVNSENLAQFLDEVERTVGKRTYQVDLWNWADNSYRSPVIDRIARKWRITKHKLMDYLMSEQNPSAGGNIMRASKAQEQAWTQSGKSTRKFSGKVYQIVSDGWDTKSHALRSMPDEWIKDHYIRFTIDYRDMYTMWARKKAARSNPKSRANPKAGYMGTMLAIGAMLGIAYLAKRSKDTA